jgi:hypothetical protein
MEGLVSEAQHVGAKGKSDELPVGLGGISAALSRSALEILGRCAQLNTCRSEGQKKAQIDTTTSAVLFLELQTVAAGTAASHNLGSGACCVNAV